MLLKIGERDVAQWRAAPGDQWRIEPDSAFILASTHNPVGTRTEMIRESKDASWKLERAWRTGPDGRVMEEYPVP